jgi:23S rRNA (cytosine1962-C5)-methyltransferase
MKQLPIIGKAAQRVRRGYPWVHRTELGKVPEGLESGEVVELVDAQRSVVGRAGWAVTSPIAARLLSLGGAGIDIANRVKAAHQRRLSLHGRDAFRVVHGEADGLPGVFVDRYGRGATVQSLSAWAEANEAEVAAAVATVCGVEVVVARNDGSGRDFEGLPRRSGVILGSGPTEVTYHEGKTAFVTDLLADAKTGGFLDQVDNHLRAAALAKPGGRALDTFSYHGGFALALAQVCGQVTAVEQDEKAVARLKANAAVNRITTVEVQTANAFDVLRAEAERKALYDVVVIDPPGLAKRDKGLEAARRAYHELNVRALKLLAPEGLLVSCSCSGKVSRDAFDEILRDAAFDARRSVQVLERRGPGIDHPALFGLPETEYLKAWFVRVAL